MSSQVEELDPRWTRAHAVWLLALCFAVGAVGHPWPLAAGALLSFGVFCVRHAPAWRARQLLPNAVTLLRLVGIGAALAVLHGSGAPFAFGLVVTWALDGLDGLVARRLDAESPFGALFDAEADAFLVLAATVELWSSGKLALWVLLGGVLRYAYVLCLAWFPARAGGVPRSRFARYAFGAVVLALALALILPSPLDALVAGLGTAWLTLSFLRSFIWLYERRDSSNA
jgi:phosphatidylglycerophosphate synthase